MVKKTKKKSGLSRLIRLVLVALVVILMWRGVDALLDAYLFPTNEALSGIASIALALAIFYFANIRFKEID